VRTPIRVKHRPRPASAATPKSTRAAGPASTSASQGQRRRRLHRAQPLGPNWPPPDWPETREEYQERLRNTATHLCRLRYFGDEERWGFAFYTYSHERYELSIFPSGEFMGPPEDAFQASAAAYLR
jgi:hypothetical protein